MYSQVIQNVLEVLAHLQSVPQTGATRAVFALYYKEFVWLVGGGKGPNPMPYLWEV